jgi:hypothetical protein
MTSNDIDSSGILSFLDSDDESDGDPMTDLDPSRRPHGLRNTQDKVHQRSTVTG